ncbi:MAG: selenocysteine-specific translation factor [Proteobacteria bacterium SG_bin9]|nr:MAG: selenocysteine-specific translation factor [Proteobacteria bacterium SG_bin9]
MIVGTAGHIDHGKTALVRALTGVDTDRLKEEKERGISIDLGFAYWSTQYGDTVGFVDVPGHERFIHNMLAGVTGIDWVILAVAANEGMKPQTNEHLAILDLLGVTRGLVALTKSDLVTDDDLQAVRSTVRARLAATTLSSVPIVAVSSLTGRGIERIRKDIADAARNAEKKSSQGRFRLAVDRCFTLPGIGTVVTGTAMSGRVCVGDTLVVSPSGIKAQVRSIHVQNSKAAEGRGGDRCALNLTGSGITKQSISRGDIVLDPALHSPSNRIDASLRLLVGENKPLSQWMPVKLHHAATEMNAHILHLSDGHFAPGREGFIQLVLDRSIAATAGDRFVVRDISGRRTLGGGRFADLRAPARRRRTPARLAQLAYLSESSERDILVGLLECPPHYVDLTAFGRDRALSDSEIDNLAAELALVLVAVRDRVFALSSSVAAGLTSLLLDTLARFHRENPNLIGIGFEQLRLVLQPRLPAVAFSGFLQNLIQSQRVVLNGTWIRLPSHALTLTGPDEKNWKRIFPLLSETHKFKPPKVRELGKLLALNETGARRLLKTLAQMGKVQEVSHDHFFTRDVLAEILDIIVDISDANDGQIGTAILRDRLNNGRRTSIELLEFFDRHGVTIRRGDFRILNRHRLDLFRLGGSRRVGAA